MPNGEEWRIDSNRGRICFGYEKPSNDDQNTLIIIIIITTYENNDSTNQRLLNIVSSFQCFILFSKFFIIIIYILFYLVWVFYQRLCNYNNTYTNIQLYCSLCCSFYVTAFDFDLVLLTKFLLTTDQCDHIPSTIETTSIDGHWYRWIKIINRF